MASFFALTAVVICLIITLFIMLGLGVGLGYNYCFVDMKAGKLDSGGSALRSGEDFEEANMDIENMRRSMGTAATSLPRRTITLPTIKATMRIPINSEIDLEALFSKLRGRNKNVTLELIT
ncbi:hypothetical protein HW555_002887 [Spodoptera exigua]|uniref:Uncharacterized protein n=1 Tax=Spodoptera exigua TaxID=7107 RepID=A0A835GLF8_SPOEX|nr:hypothetical protein HW555_002887 [Spodoptera exigua]